MGNQRNDLLDLHPVSVAAAVLGGRPQRAAGRDAEPEEAVEARPGLAARLLAALRNPRRPASHPETTRV